MAVTIQRLAGYLRLQSPSAVVDDPDALELYLAAAKSRARSSGVPDYENNAEYDLFILALASMEYDNRSFGAPLMDPEKAERMINGFVLRLRHAKEDSEGEAGYGYVFALALPGDGESEEYVYAVARTGYGGSDEYVRAVARIGSEAGL